MQITSYGGVREVTGSIPLLSVNSDRILLDCGMFQGRRKESAERNRILPIDPGILTNVVLSHAHIDHSGRIPLLVKKNFRGRVICTRVTAAACEYLLMDAGHIQESDAQYLQPASLYIFFCDDDYSHYLQLVRTLPLLKIIQTPWDTFLN
jgi:metallo-beta-lactamase family protein